MVGDNTVALGAGNNVDIVAATNTDSSWRFKEEKKSGLMGTGGIGITVGSSKSTHDLREAGTTQSQSFSTVGSTGGNVVIAAGNQAHIGGADLIAGKDMSLSGSSVIIDPGHDKRTRDETFEQKKSGLTLALSGAVGGAINNAVNSAQDAKNESDGRLAALQATKSVLSGMQAGQAVALDAADSGNTENPSTNAIGVSASLTTQKSKSEQHVRSDEVTGSTLNVGNNLSITATGKNKGPNSGDIVIAGSQLKAGGDTVLDAKNDILLAGAANTQQTTGKNSSSGGGVGIGIGVGSGGWGISVFANGNSAHGKDKGNGTDWTETTIDSGKTVTIKSGNDTVLDGALVNGNKIVADVGHDLLMRSQQDNNDYDSKQTSVAGGGSFTFGSMSGSAYMSVSQDKMKSRFDSVAEQTGLYAGDGGFDITVGNHTQLDGAVIASTATADKNNLDTGTLGFSDIHNEADFKTQHTGGSFNTGGSIAGQFASNAANALLAGGGNKGHAEGTTQAAVADGTITIRDKDNQKQDVADLSRDTEHANDNISPIFDKEKEQKRLQEIQLIGEVGSQAADVARTQGDLAGRKAAKDPDSLEEARQQLAKEGKPVTDAAVAERAYNNASSFYGTGGVVQRGLQAVTGALTALAGGGNLAGALAGASAPELANIIGHRSGLSDDEALIAHAVLGGVVASLQGNSAAAGAAGALSGELAARAIKDQMFPGKSNSELSESDKQLISNLATLASGLAGNLTGGNSAGTTAGAQAGKNAVENNYLSSTEKSLQTELNHKQSLTPKEQQERDALNRKDAETSKTLVDACMNGSASACTAARQDALEKQDSYQNLGYQNTKESQAGYQQIQQLLNGTGPEAKQTQELFNGMVAAYMRTGMSEEAAKSAVGYQLGAMYIVGGVAGIGSGKAVEGSLAGKNSTVKENAGIRPTVTAELEVNGQKFKDTNQTARPAEQANKDQPTLISDRVTSKEQSLVEKGKTNNLPLPNSNMANAHAEIGAIQQAYNAGKTQDANLTINVAGKDVCSYCRGDIAAAAQASGAKSVTINAIDDKTGLPKTYIWEPGMKSIREINK